MPNTDEEPSGVVGGFLRSPTEMVTAYFQPYRHKMYAHLRIMVPSAEEEGEWVHTVKGVGIQLDQVPKLRDAVKQLLEVAAPNKVVATIPVGKDRSTSVPTRLGVSNTFSFDVSTKAMTENGTRVRRE